MLDIKEALTSGRRCFCNERIHILSIGMLHGLAGWKTLSARSYQEVYHFWIEVLVGAGVGLQAI